MLFLLTVEDLKLQQQQLKCPALSVSNTDTTSGLVLQISLNSISSSGESSGCGTRRSTNQWRWCVLVLRISQGG